ncbi:toxin-antitoxin system YwqK family antitoxin [Helicobacter didelphidarum]|nr:toxin-antitoxin system YwqK family antitoxin [Helicobacter didelphidarum]
MKKLAFIALCAMISVYFVGCGINEDSIPTPSSEDYSHLPECQNEEDRINGCLWIYSDESGKFRTETPIKNGEANGIGRSYLYGHTLCETQFVDSIPVSAALCFDMRGNPKNGVVKEYHENGNLAYEVEFKNGKVQGVEKTYHTNGKLRFHVSYKNGKKNGVEKVYGENGKLSMETPYKNNKRDGIEKSYYVDGDIMQETSYKYGKKNGVEKLYDEHGLLHLSIVYENDKAISGTCGNGKTIDSQKLSEFDRWNTNKLGCD